MAWKESNVVDERLKFVARLLEGEKMAPLCREFGISRKTRYKIYSRYKDCGLDSRFLLACEALESTKENTAFTVFERVFKEYGLPRAIRTDNGLPFASPNSLYGLSRLSVWWLRLGIHLERIKPGNPQQNGRHERMHLTFKKETTRPTEFNLLQQQERFDKFQQVYNYQRPHQAIAMRYPAELYTPSARKYMGLPDLDYPFHDKTIIVTTCGRICLDKKKVNLSTVLSGQKVGISQKDDKIWLVTFMNYYLGYFDIRVM